MSPTPGGYTNIKNQTKQDTKNSQFQPENTSHDRKLRSNSSPAASSALRALSLLLQNVLSQNFIYQNRTEQQNFHKPAKNFNYAQRYRDSQADSKAFPDLTLSGPGSIHRHSEILASEYRLSSSYMSTSGKQPQSLVKSS